LIEILIVLAIVALLSSLTLPSYRHSVQQGGRLEAIAALLDFQLTQAGYLAEHGSYADSFNQLGWSGDRLAGKNYTLSFSRMSANHWIALATPAATQMGDECGVFAISDQGIISAQQYANATCWSGY
jgi:Tfp pilus assembly protein PilE